MKILLLTLFVLLLVAIAAWAQSDAMFLEGPGYLIGCFHNGDPNQFQGYCETDEQDLPTCQVYCQATYP